jgi:hypothetical protein
LVKKLKFWGLEGKGMGERGSVWGKRKNRGVFGKIAIFFPLPPFELDREQGGSNRAGGRPVGVLAGGSGHGDGRG